MRLWIVRHGKAEQASPSGLDEDRPLRPRGRRQAEWLGERLAASAPDLIIASRFDRAITTAQILQRYSRAPLRLFGALEVGHPPSAAIEIVQSHAAHASLVLVGHNPQLSELVWTLTRGVPAQESGLRTGEAAVIELDPASPVGGGRLLERLRMAEDD